MAYPASMEVSVIHQDRQGGANVTHKQGWRASKSTAWIQPMHSLKLAHRHKSNSGHHVLH